ncbi:head-tail joining protein [Geopsychrobacter electrodiphilus]|uniref:head-tail joining protein n=1 Tax=Geopsychrobacter electrodiphilus TaxID=225196 RepID=UPI000380C9D8|nr:hypothetical protein [Geopsychrobacter electrodiphilus]
MKFDDTDLDTILDAMGEDVVITDGSPGGYPCKGIFKSPYNRRDVGTDGSIGGYLPALKLKMTDYSASGSQQGTALHVAGTNYTIVSQEPTRPDGAGWVVVELEES